MKASSANDNIWVAAGDGQLERIKVLLEEGVDPNGKDEFGYTPIHAAVSYAQKEVLECLLSHGGDINVEDADKDTPLYVCETVEMAKFMLEHGANPEHKNDEDISPAQAAFNEGWVEVAQMLAELTHESLEQEKPLLDDTSLEETFQDDGEVDAAFATQIEQVMQRIQDQGGVEDEEELRDIVTKMLLEQIRASADEPPSS
ncbi:ankyrin [Hesseltinella vesiculosa]|uniref:Ankyrin n=1 Tax=Hesseltinella vesiculosa TaxID=101127 RepID=A0A1X2GXH0_9FUNG|nr:ankyrin [Hesseltinella vesiculosa]